MGFLITSYGLMKEIKGSMIYGILFVTLISWFRDTSVTFFPHTTLGDANNNYFKKVVDFHKIESTAGAISFTNFNRTDVWLALATLLYVDMLATTGTLFTMTEIGGFINDQGNFEGEYVAYMVDARISIVPAFVTILRMPLTYSISNGIIGGIGLYVALSLYDWILGLVRRFLKLRKTLVKEHNQVSAASGGGGGSVDPSIVEVV
ncbi:hypothetical protein EZV62_023863 [Acer yangbiense]|uniref:Uncharacterized protein n=1 Tax=Acer yangbiense TaxID=1000413 RepID=A0A5C7H3M8_9ROSI|nr:hypothetical protein EZV62_023863 [Acer yangbiense]